MKKGFSLIELLIVIVIIGVVYTLVITKLHTVNNQEAEQLTLQTLKSYVAKFLGEANGAQVLCFEDCERCELYVDGVKRADLPKLVSKDVRIYRYDQTFGMQEVIPELFFDKEGLEEELCFSFKFFKEGVTQQYYIEDDGKVYDYTDPFSDLKVYETLEDLQDAKEKTKQEVMQ
ncbi:MAG: prepilin-type N-terminal cleavage/methylation domain-containing protein [Epsilonproteobacteria bacterium]|nr:prepilin-type N-terminal cleavage/methylation domain-containing protein [Campylobacterota bacterium]